MPALLGLDPAVQLDVASCSGKAAIIPHPVGNIYNDYADALQRSSAEVVYISLHNSAHYEWALKSLQSGRHVVIDKPAFLTVAETMIALELADKAGRCMAEATTFEYHSQFFHIDAFLSTFGPLNCISAQFNIPLLPTDNFRNHPDKGGGCLADMGPYAAAVARRFGSGNRMYIAAVSGKRHPQTGVDIGFSILVGFADGLRISGDFGFGGEYVNRVSFMAEGGTLMINRIFSPPPDHAPEWQMTLENTAKTEVRPADDAFKSFWVEFDTAIENGAYGAFGQNLLADATFRERIRYQIERAQNVG